MRAKLLDWMLGVRLPLPAHPAQIGRTYYLSAKAIQLSFSYVDAFLSAVGVTKDIL